MLLGHAAPYAGACSTTHTGPHHSAGAPSHRMTHRRTGGTTDGAANHRTRLAGTPGANGRPRSPTQCPAYHCALFASHALANGRAGRGTGTAPQQGCPVVSMGGVYQGQQAQGGKRGTQNFCR